jgi:hypothetical protein
MLVRKFLTTSNLDGRVNLQSISNFFSNGMTDIRNFLFFIQSVLYIQCILDNPN